LGLIVCIDGSGKPSRAKVQLTIINGSIEAIRENQPSHPGQTPDNSDFGFGIADCLDLGIRIAE